MWYFPFSALTLLVGWQEGHADCKKLGVGWMNEWMNVFKVTLSQFKLLQGHWTKVTGCKCQLLVKMRAVMSGQSSNDALNRSFEVVPKHVQRRDSPDARRQRVLGTCCCHWKGSVTDCGLANWRVDVLANQRRWRASTSVARWSDSAR